MKLKLAFIASILCSSSAWAVDLQYSVCQIGTEGTDDVYLLPCEAHATQNACPSNMWIHWRLDTPAGRGMLANAQVALAAGKKIIVRVQGCSANVDHAVMLRLTSTNN